MYSFAPLADTSQTHGGFYFVAAVALFILIVVISSIKDDPRLGIITVLTLAALTWWVHYESYHPKNNKPPLNEQVIGTFIRTQGEGWNEKSGKTRADVHVLYVVYRVPAGDVTLQAIPGAAYPQQAILYKN